MTDTPAASESDTVDAPTAADGRVPGRRGRETRAKLLEATAEALTTTAYRDLKVVDIARSVGSSPATFYQYFPDVGTAIKELAADVAADATRLLEPLEDATWAGRSAYATATALADAFLEFWADHEALLRVVDLEIAEGDQEYRALRNQILGPVTLGLRDAIAEQQKAGRIPDHVDPAAQGAVLVSMLSHVVAHRSGLESWGVATNSARESMARIVCWSVTGRKPA